jgi:double-stranded RNA-binding protein Staufen
MRPPRSFYVSLKVGTREFIGEGISRQTARHNAAKKALEILRSLKIPENTEQITQETNFSVEPTKDVPDDDGMRIVFVELSRK